MNIDSIKKLSIGAHHILFIMALAHLAAVPFATRPWKYFFTAVFFLFVGLVFLGFTKPKA